MIAEKAWAKLHGTYHAIGNGGSNLQVLSHLTNDPYYKINTRGKGYTETNALGKSLWASLLRWTARDYLVFFGTDSQSWVSNHAYQVVGAYEVTVNGAV